MSDLSNAHSAVATTLRDAWDTRTPCAPPSAEHPDLTPADAYRIQRANVVHRLRRGMHGVRTRHLGYKVGLTSAALQNWLNIDQPDFGCLLSDMEVPDGGTIDTSLLMQPKIEAEIAFVLGRPLEGPVGTADVLRATDVMLPALEIIDSRIVDWNITYPDTIADNASSALFVLGTTPIPSSVDLRTIGMTMRRNGRIVSVGAGAACLGNPVAAVAWLANTLARLGTSLRAGDVVLSGALGPVDSLVAGDWFEARIGRTRVTVRAE